ncbi:uncharacterized protein RhoGAP71E [Hetaerina americana]|uniref:uncharacterized protein RhoGAP71E n=1 Tax=Hetaerina americana TaxID=62018 RepID=UPI003A7F5E8F
MTSWTERMHRRAATFGNVVTSCGHPSVPYPRRLEKVKFGVPLDEVCKNDIPGPLLVLILKLNKEAPFKKDVFRAPGHQGNMKKLVHFLQNGRLVNIDNFSPYTIASVLKKFLRKLPGGIFGWEGERRLFDVIGASTVVPGEGCLEGTEGSGTVMDIVEQRDQIHRLITSLPIHTQRLLVLLFGTFRVIATNAERAHTGMTSEALGVSVAPSFFHSCVSGGEGTRMEDVLRFKVATRIMKFLIDNFGVSNLFGRENYEFYARITGRILKVEEDWIFSFRYPPDTVVSREVSLEAEKTWLLYECERWGLNYNLEAMSHQEESQSTPALLHIPTDSALSGGSGSGVGSIPGEATTSLGIIPENNLLESYTRLSISLEENGLFKGSSRSSSTSANSHRMTLEELRAVNRYAESTKSLSYLPQVHERQTARMRTRSEWFLSPALQEHRQQPSHLQHYYHPHYLLHQNTNHLHSPNFCNQHHLPFHSSQHQEHPLMMGSMAVVPIDIDSDPSSIHVLRGSNNRSSSGNIVGAGLSASSESVKPGIVRRSSSRGGERRLVHRNSSRCRNKENGAKARGGDLGNAGIMSSGSVEGICAVSGMVSGKGSTSATDIVGARDSMDMASPGVCHGSGEIRGSGSAGGVGDAGVAGGGLGGAGSDGDEPGSVARNSGNISERDSDMDVQTYHVTLTYKPRI